MSMTLTEIRQELMQQHAGLRELAAATRAAADQVKGGASGARDALRTNIAMLDQALHAHNDREEELLGAIIKTIDAWGEVRASLMDEHHEAEHERILGTLRSAADAPDPTAAAEMVHGVLAELADHMEHEEQEILSPNVLRDDIYTVDYGGG